MTRTPTHPGEMLAEEFMKPLDMSARELVRQIDVPHNRISELLAGRRAMTADTALRLEPGLFPTRPTAEPSERT